MPSYRVRRPFRVLAAVVAIPPLVLGMMLLVESFVEHNVLDFLFGVGVLVFAGTFFYVAATGGVPAAVEEYGLDDAAEVEALRAKMTRLGRFIP